MRTLTEIVARLNQIEEEDLFGFESSDLLHFLPFEQAQPFLKPEATKEIWEKEGVPELTEEKVRSELVGYLPFAWDKALGHRGLSAGRSVSHLRAWLWLLGDDELVTFIDADGNYSQYGVPVLKKVSEKYGYKLPDDPAVERMARGEPCRPDCDEGCGH